MKKILILVLTLFVFTFINTRSPKAVVIDFSEFQTEFQINSKSNLKQANSYWTTTFNENSLDFKVDVVDERIIVKDSFDYSDGILVRFSLLSSSTAAFSAGKTSEIKVKADGTYEFNRYSSGKFREEAPQNHAGTVIEVTDLLYKGEKVGYTVNMSLPYSALKTTKEDAKGTVTFAPYLYNENINSSAIKASKGVNKDYEYSSEDQKTFVILKGNDSYKNNTGSFTTGVFAQVSDNTKWNISEDYADGNDARRVTLNGVNGNDNHLRFYQSNENQLYVYATFKVTDIYNGEKFGKYGIEFRNKSGNGVFILLEAASPSGNRDGAKKSQPAGYVTVKGNGYDWSTFKNVSANYLCVTDTVELAVYRDKDLFYIFVDGNFVTALSNPGGLKDEKIYPELVSFNVGLEVTKYGVKEDTEEVNQILNNFTSDGCIFAAPNLAMTPAKTWDLSQDVAGNSGVVTLTGHDRADNNLYFNTSSTPSGFLYAKTRIRVTGINNADYFPKYGMCLFDGSGTKGMFYYVSADMASTSVQPSLSNMTGAFIGHNTFNNTWGGWSQTSNSVANNKDVTMELVYGGGLLYCFCDGRLVSTQKYAPTKANIYMGLKSFGLKLELTDYYASNDVADPLVQNTLSKIQGFTIGSSGATTDVNSIIAAIPDEEVITPNDPAVVGDYGYLTIKTITCYVGNGAKAINPVFSNPLAKEKVEYTYESDNIVIKNGYVVGVKGGTSTVVTAKTNHLETKFIVKVRELATKFISDYEYFLEHQKEVEFGSSPIVFFGDSFFDQRYFWTNFYNDLEAINPENKVYITGIGGTTIEQWLGYAEHLVYDLKPSYLVIHLGTNDLFDTQITEDSCYNFFMQFVSEIHLNLPNTKIYYIGIEPRSYSIPNITMAETTPLLISINNRMSKYCEGKDYITFIESFDHFSHADGSINNSMFKDGVHPVNSEYKYYIDLLIERGLPIRSKM